MVNICTLEQLQVLIGKGIVKGCGCCKARFEEDDLACARQTGICPYCNNKLVKVFTKTCQQKLYEFRGCVLTGAVFFISGDARVLWNIKSKAV